MTGGLGRWVRKVPGLRVIYILLGALVRSFGLAVGKWPAAAAWYLADFHRFSKHSTSSTFALSTEYLWPCLKDKRSHTPVEPVYFLQDTWAAKKIFALKPSRHHDIGSSAMTMAILSQWVPVTMVDIRPLDIALQGLSFEKGSILNLPFADDSIESLSSLCVVEHVGLGRYGDEIDVRGSEKALAELKRVLMPGGSLFLSVPVDRQCRVYFNAHRAFTRDYLMQLVDGLTVVDEQYQYGTGLYPAYDPERGFGTGLYHLVKGAR